MEGLADLPERVTRLEEEMRTGFDRVRDEIRAGDEETRNRMLILHEDVIAKLALLQEGIDRFDGGSRRRRSGRSGKR